MNDRDRLEQIEMQSYAASLALLRAEQADSRDSHRLYRQAEISLQQLRDLVRSGPISQNELGESIREELEESLPEES